MAKKDLIAVILGLESDLKAEGVTFESNNLTEKDNTEAQLKEEIVRLEALLPSEDDGEGGSGEGSGETTGSTEQGQTDVEEVWNIKLNKGVNIELVVDGKRVVLEGGKTHQFGVAYAKEILAKNLGVQED
ncbi:hypothetical protein OTK51_19080 [Vibrio scophthalmi]|uniref:hypothetical protein n=1 Tax=Vibrio scophthalmi TaxID=45658 RepID=UPI0022850648|nr:hypothetical protein [Vibrio scophthalmi]MCY9805531.1 hypothetical protein [Vibrio scophthalmi]